MSLFINDADYKVTKMVEGKQVMCPFFRTWRNMKERCNKNTTRNPSYKSCMVCDQWHLFSNFRVWMEGQSWEGKELDKDILGDGKIYSPENCCYVPSYVNLSLVLSDSSRGMYPVGVSYMKRPKKMNRELLNPYQSYIRCGDKKLHLGMFSNPESAHKAWQTSKVAQLEKVKVRYSKERDFDPRVLNALELKVVALQEDILENRETISL